MPCLNGGACIETPNGTGYSCRCETDVYRGDNCEEHVMICSSGFNPCSLSLRCITNHRGITGEALCNCPGPNFEPGLVF